MFSSIENIIKAIKKLSFFTGFCCLFFGLFIAVVHQESQYLADRNIFILGLIFSGIGIICITLSAIRKEKFSIFRVFITIWLVEAFFILALTLFYSAYLKRLMLGFWITSFLAFGILFINETANRLLFGINDRKKQKTSDNEDASLDIGKEKIGQGDDFIEMAPTVDTISSEFAVDVLSVTLYLGAIFATFAYSFFIPDNDNPSFFGGIDVKTVALGTAGLVTFFWAAKAAKNKSIELEEKKQDGKRRDNEIKMAEARDTAQLIAKASELLGSENDAQKNAGLAFLNTVASQKGGPLQKEAFNLLADFILSDADTKTSNKPHTRAISYVNNLLKDQCRDFELNEWIEVTSVELEKSNKNYKFEQLNILYREFRFSPFFPYLVNYPRTEKKIYYNNCTFKYFSGKNNFPMIDGIYAENCVFRYCKIGFIADYSNEIIYRSKRGCTFFLPRCKKRVLIL